MHCIYGIFATKLDILSHLPAVVTETFASFQMSKERERSTFSKADVHMEVNVMLVICFHFYFLSVSSPTSAITVNKSVGVWEWGLAVFNNTSPWERPDVNVDVKQSN